MLQEEAVRRCGYACVVIHEVHFVFSGLTPGSAMCLVSLALVLISNLLLFRPAWMALKQASSIAMHCLRCGAVERVTRHQYSLYSFEYSCLPFEGMGQGKRAWIWTAEDSCGGYGVCIAVSSVPSWGKDEKLGVTIQKVTPLCNLPIPLDVMDEGPHPTGITQQHFKL